MMVGDGTPVNSDPPVAQKKGESRSGSGGFSEYLGDFHPFPERRSALRFKASAVTNKVDSNDRALFKFDMKPAHFLRILIEKYFLY
jgi:hypothetical protein